MNKYAFQLAFAYMGVIIGGGFASGQEVLQFFTGYGLASIGGTLLAGFLFAFLGRQIAEMSTQLQAESHKHVLLTLFGRRAGQAMDFLLTFFLFGVGIAMLAATGSLFEQQFGLSPALGGLFMTLLTVGTLCLNVRRIINLVSAATPFLLCMVLIITAYSLFTSNANMDELLMLASEQETVAPHWALGALLYASFNIAVGFPMLAVISGRNTDRKTTTLGGIIGGVGLGVLIMLINIALLFNLNQLQGAELPTLALAARVSPVAGILMSISIICMIYSTSVGMFFAFSARFAKPETGRFRIFSIASGFIGLGLSLVGFTKLVGTVYPLLGYLGLLLIAAIGVNWYRIRGRSTQAAATQSGT
ncbi:YkvI family membrane protein [Pollutimonas harenae]|uniref:Membrane protein YkvI n=1 Tax=Pollutimonas harenae TaxID=657015 RepID=A0A853GUC4_9BURK|nr:hypothetical protein [Pollutimonas harenae]NYT85871.1 hypothetical protein [Pollutimonas harenae]TEA70927.1 hypothetical protein ERD84_09740 [Pollutimonas harenae]